MIHIAMTIARTHGSGFGHWSGGGIAGRMDGDGFGGEASNFGDGSTFETRWLSDAHEGGGMSHDTELLADQSSHLATLLILANNL